MKRSVGACMLILGGLVVLAWVGAEQVRAQMATAAVVWPAAELKWSDNPAMQGAKIAVLWGDPRTGAYGALKKMPGGNSLPSHTHTHDQRVITLSGNVLLSIEGSAPRELMPGSYAFIPGGLKHAADCKPGPDCTYFEEQAGASDIQFIEGSAPKK